MQFQPPASSPLIPIFETSLTQGAALLLLLMVASLVVTVVNRILFGRRRNWRYAGRRTYKGVSGRFAVTEKLSPKRADAGTMTAYERAHRGNFAAKSIFNRSESRLFRFLAGEVNGCSPSLFVMGQTSLREIVRTDDPFIRGGGHYALGDRRVDFTITDEHGRVLIAVEYHGGGHFQNNARERDEIKRIVLEKAGIPLLIVKQGESPADVRKRLSEKLAALGYRSAATHLDQAEADAHRNS